MRAIVFQQLSGKAANTIHERLLGLFPGVEYPTPGDVLAVSVEQMRSVGMSRPKASYAHDLASKVLDGTLRLDDMEDLTDDEVREEVVKVKGLGVWSADMFLIFALNRPDVWPVLDLGVRKGLEKLVGKEGMKPAEVESFGERWRPYRSAAAWYMWRVFEAKA